jgi:hypothetical protein
LIAGPSSNVASPESGEASSRRKPRLDLSAITESLRAVEAHFESLNSDLTVPRDPMCSEVVDNLIAAYEYVDALLDADVDLLTRGNSQHLLRLNNLVLWGARGTDTVARETQLKATERHFYNDASLGGIRSLMNYVADHRADNVWSRSAGVYIQILTAPQLFIEGNHRTAAVVVSQVLARSGNPPVVLTERNSKTYFDLSSMLKVCRKRSLRSAIEILKLRRQLAKFLENEADGRFLSC